MNFEMISWKVNYHALNALDQNLTNPTVSWFLYLILIKKENAWLIQAKKEIAH